MINDRKLKIPGYTQMKNIITKIINTGVHKDLEPDTAKRIRVVNSLSLVGVIIGSVMVFYSISANWSWLAILCLALIIPSQILPIVLNSFHKFIISRVYLVVWDNLYLLFMSISFGIEIHYQYFMIITIGLPLVFFKDEIGFFKFGLSMIAILCWLFVEWYFTIFEAIFPIEKTFVFYVRLINDFIIFTTVFAMFVIFTEESDKQIDEIEEKATKLSKANAQLEQFSYIVSHDLKTPLRTIVSFTQLIESGHGHELNKEVTSLFSFIKEGAVRMNGLISSVLEYSRSGMDSYGLTSFNLSKLLGGIIELIDVPDNITLSYNNDLPTIYGSFTQLEQVLTNLIGNAIKYHDKDKGLIKITVSRQNSDFLKIEVSDDGPGIKPEYQAKVFEMFKTANEVSPIDSNGIGLTIVTKLVELNQGQVGLESEYGVGSNFWFTWPLSVDKLSLLSLSQRTLVQ